MIVPQKVSKRDEKNVERPEVIDRVLDEAEAYYRATLLLEEKRNRDELFSPVIMNATFSCELFSKVILYTEKEKGLIKGHTLKSLYNSFSEDVKGKLHCLFANTTKERLISWIDDIDELFEFWRYRYEYRSYSTHYSFVLEYMEALRKVANDIVKGN